MFILDPEENGAFGPDANGTGPFEIVEFTVGKGAKYKARTDYWGNGPYLDTFELSTSATIRVPVSPRWPPSRWMACRKPMRSRSIR